MTEAAPSLEVLMETLEAHSTRTFDGIVESLGTLDHKGSRIQYLLIAPETNARRSGLVVCHSFLEFATLQPAEVAFGRVAAEAGFGSIYVHAPGAGESEGLPQTCTVEARIEAALLAARHLLDTQENVDTPCFFGARLGGAIAAFAAGRFGYGTATIMWDPTFDPATYLKQARKVARISAIAGRQRAFSDIERQLEDQEWASLLGNPVNRSLLDDLDDIASLERLSLPGPALVVGTNDRALSGTLSTLRRRGAHVDAVSLDRRDLGGMGLSIKDALAAIRPTVDWMKEGLD